MAKTTAEIVAEEKKKIEQAKARIQAAMAKDSAKERKLDTRRKVILGGLLMDNAKRDPSWNRALTALIKKVSRENDLKAFEGYEIPPMPSSPGENQ